MKFLHMVAYHKKSKKHVIQKYSKIYSLILIRGIFHLTWLLSWIILCCFLLKLFITSYSTKYVFNPKMLVSLYSWNWNMRIHQKTFLHWNSLLILLWYTTSKLWKCDWFCHQTIYLQVYSLKTFSEICK